MRSLPSRFIDDGAAIALCQPIQKSDRFHNPNLRHLDGLWQVGLWIKQEYEKFDYDKPVLEYLRRVWAKHRDYLRDSPQGSDATA